MKNAVFFFGNGTAEGNKDQKNLLGGKGANLAEMTNIGLPVPPGFTISTEVCMDFVRTGRYPKTLQKEVAATLSKLERATKKRFGDIHNPLLVSVRSGARASMPGMMDTVLNLGLNDKTVAGLIDLTKNERFAWDAYRRFVSMYGDVVLELKPTSKEERDPFEILLEKKKHDRGVANDTDLTGADLKELVGEFKQLIRERTGRAFPESPLDQLWGAIGAVFRSWNNSRAISYRKLNNIPFDWGTAVNVQAMVFGNMGDDSGTGVAFTRDPATGENKFYGEFLINAQGEDVVAGIRTPRQIADLAGEMPKIFKQLMKVRSTLEKHYKDVMDIEFTIERGTLYMLQCRVGKRTGFAAVRCAVEMCEEKLISKEAALERVDPETLNQLLRPIFNGDAKKTAVGEGRMLAKGLPAGPGAATGRIVFFADDAKDWAARGETVILARHETSPEDIEGMNASLGFLTAFGGMTSHAALVARQMGKVAIVGCGDITFDYHARAMTIKLKLGGTKVMREGDWISLDGFAGEVIAGRLETKPSEVVSVLVEKTLKPTAAPVYQLYSKLLKWSDEFRELGVRANADQPDQAAVAIAFGAEGIGLCRTEHMFFGEGKIEPMREMILAESKDERKKALAKLLPLQRADFAGIFRAMGPRPVTIRSLDPPLHEFLPHESHEQEILARSLGKSLAQVQARVESLHESNPMLGHRGCRLGISYPEITEMQAEAILQAACDVAIEGGKPQPEIMIPLVGTVKEFTSQEAVVRETAQRVFTERNMRVKYTVGTMIEVPRGALTAAEIASRAEFFSFGTNDLTQTTFGLSRDDVPKVLATYIDKDIYPVDPFVTIDEAGVGRLMKIAVEDGRSARPDLKIGICGEHGGDPASVTTCHKLNLNYVSCSPFRIPIARLAAARAAIAGRKAEAAAAGTPSKPKPKAKIKAKAKKVARR
ncbi:MAG: pyruvate, phosphate dikinase [Planctomycetes bacterium]|nr:pyruvate, phosphate dikinase [Planctomycetota bacterium]